jgi:hypothetical protein
MEEKSRKGVRIESEQFISYKLYDAKNRICDEGMALAKDISRTGVAVENRKKFEIGARADLTIALSDDLVQVEGIVRNVSQIDEKNFMIGIEFTKITDDQIKRLKKDFPEI